ncbi:hypothetical protein AK88_04230 [Plasmodium fragile]|uniref:ubiquitinyl hydrolase 1 n=1 Tax=Plasmodium fragile TaxID=5857 RepID=A0A0D9QH53_PLAFR|nr:uncharacterized protein AK88_04230 [Plasmodium fragile]KJP86107.1 hypothetical protein AK88_04230 [Plasmodium fragile]
MQKSNSDSLSEWCLIESNPCIFNDMLSRMGAKNLSVEDVYDLGFFEDYIWNRGVVSVENVLGIEEYRSEKEKGWATSPMEDGEGATNTPAQKTDLQKGLYSSTVTTEDKYNKLIKNESNVYGIIFLFNIGKSYKRNKFVEHSVPENLFFAKQVIPNACATQAILSIVLNKEVELNEEIKNIKSFSDNFDSSMKGLTLSNCNVLRNIHNSYKPPIYIEKENLHDEKGKSNDSFHFVSYIEFGGSVYMLDGLQEGPVLIGHTNGEDEQHSWIDLARQHIKKEISEICNASGIGEEGDSRFNILAVIKDKEHIINEFCNIHRIVKQRVNTKLRNLGNEEVDLSDEINEENFNYPTIPTVEELPQDIPELLLIAQKATLEINFLQALLQEQMQLKLTWNKELTFKFFNFYPFVMSSLKLMAKHNILKEAYEKEKEKQKRKDDINFFCKFENDLDEKKSRRASNERPLACYDNFCVPPSECDALEQSYLYTLLHNEDFTRDKRSCSSMGFIFNKLFLQLAHFDQQLRRDIHRGRFFQKGKRRGTAAKGKLQRGASKLCANKNRVFPGNPYTNLVNDSHVTEQRITYEEDEDAMFHHLAYSQLQDNLLQFYLPPGRYASRTPLRKNRATRANEGQHSQRYDIGAECAKPSGDLISRGKLSARGVKKKTKKTKHTLSTAKRRGSHQVGEMKEKEKNNEASDIHPLSNPKAFIRLYNYSSSEDSDMSFSKFLPEPRNKIFSFKKQKRKYTRRCNGTHFKGEQSVFQAELSDDGGRGDYSFAASKRKLHPPTGRNLSDCPTMSGCHEGFRNPHLRGNVLGKGATPHALRLTKKRSFSESSPIVARLSEQRANSRSIKVCRRRSYGRHHRGYASSVVASTCEETREDCTRFPNLMNAKRGKEKKMMKMQILEGLNQSSYDPGHLERMVSSKCFPLPRERLRHTLNRKNVELKPVGGDKNTMKKKTETISTFSWSKKWACARRLQYCSLYVEENYEMIVELHRNEYPLNDFYLTYVYVMALIKLKRCALCWEYLLRVNRLREAHRATGANASCVAGLLHFLWGKLYEKLLLCRLSTAEYSKMVLDHVGKSGPTLHTRLRAHEVTGAASQIGMTDLQPFILVCLDKLIGTGQLKRREEITTLKFVHMNNNLGRILNFYFCKVGSNEEFPHNLSDYTNTQNEVTFGCPPHRNRHKSCVGAVRMLRPPRVSRSEVRQEGTHDGVTHDRVAYDRLPNSANHNYVHFTNGWKATPPWPSENNARMRNSAVGKQKDRGGGYPQQTPPWPDHRQCRRVLLSIPPKRMHVQEHTNIKGSHHGVIFPPRGLVQMSREVNRKVHINVSNILSRGTSDSDEVSEGREVSILGRYDHYTVRSYTFMGGHKGEDLAQKEFLAHFDFLLRSGHVLPEHKVRPHYDDFFVCLFRLYFRSCSKWVIKRAILWAANTPSNKAALKTAQRLAMRLKLIDVCPVNAFSPKGDRQMCHEESLPTVGKQSMYCSDHPLWCGKSLRIEKVTLPDLLHIILFCHKHFHFVNAYCLSEYALRRENALGEEDVILLFIESITSMHSVVCTSQQKIERLLQLYNARVNYTACKSRHYSENGKQNCAYTKDHLDYYLHGVIALLKEDYDQALFYFNKCVSVKRKFFQAYVCILHILCCSPKRSTLNSRQKKKIFHHCLKLKPVSVSPYLVYCSSVVRKLQLDLNHEREKRGPDNGRKQNLLIESATFLRGIFSKAMHLDNKNPFLYNELFVYHFLRKDFIQCKVALRKMLLIQDFSTPCCNYFPLSVVLYNSSVFYFLCENNLNKSEKKVIEILHNNPFDVKALNLLTFLLFLKRDEYWTRFFDYSMYVERSLLSRNAGSQQTYLCQTFFNRLRETRDLGLLARYYGALKAVRKSFPFVLNYIHARYSP